MPRKRTTPTKLTFGGRTLRYTPRGRGRAYIEAPAGENPDGTVRYARAFLGNWDGDATRLPPDVRDRAERLGNVIVQSGGYLPPDWAERIGMAPPSATKGTGGPTVAQLWTAFEAHGKGHYVHPDGTPTRELGNFKASTKVLRDLFGARPLATLQRSDFETVKRRMIQDGRAVGYINNSLRRCKTMLRWAWKNELCPKSTLEAIERVERIDPARPGQAHVTDPVLPVPDEHIDATRPHVSTQVWALIQLCRETGMRPGEAVRMRPADLDTSRSLWIYTPKQHKTAHKGIRRDVPVWDHLRPILEPHLRATERDTDHIFDPRRDGTLSGRPTAMRCFTVVRFNAEVTRACKLAGVPHWSVGRLRHNAAQWFHNHITEDAAAAVLGHSFASTTRRHYIADSRGKLERIAQSVTPKKTLKLAQ